jgi:hypothetical protein
MEVVDIDLAIIIVMLVGDGLRVSSEVACVYL